MLEAHPMTNIDPDTITDSAIKTLLSEKSGISELLRKAA